MRWAFISDIHANWPAFESVMSEIDEERADAVFCLGDLVNFAGWDNEVVEYIRRHHIPTVQGNHDRGIGNARDEFPFSSKGEKQRQFGLSSIALVNRTIREDHREYLRQLPFLLQAVWPAKKEPITIVMTHGSPEDVNEYVMPDTTDYHLQHLLRVANAGILILGHTHRPFYRWVSLDNGRQGCVINAGSVGKPKHGDNQACYLMLEIRANEGTDLTSMIIPEFRYVPYNTNGVKEHIHHLGLGDAYDEFLDKGQEE